MTDVLRIAHPQNCPPYGNSRVGICEIHHVSNSNSNMVIFVYLVQVVMIMGIIEDVDDDDVPGLMEKVTCKSPSNALQT